MTELGFWSRGVGVGLMACVGSGCVVAGQDHHHSSLPDPNGASGYTMMGPHMKVTVKPPADPDDLDLAKVLVDGTRRIIEKYKDHRLAQRDGYKPFLPHLPLPEYHFTNYWYGAEAAFRFNVEHPTSLLYVKEGKGYRLTGVMFTAAASASLEELNRRVPLSVAQWHLHVNFCLPPPGRRAEMFRPNPRFGLEGSIATEQECDEAGGRFLPRLFGWMVHVYPYEERTEDVFRIPGHHQHGEEERQGEKHRH
jgi:hypothetical protein